MAVAPYSLRLSPPPRLDAMLSPQLRPHLRRRVSARVAAAGTSWSPAAGDSEDGVGGWWVPEYEKPMKQERGRIGRAVVVGLGACAAIALAGLAWRFPSSRTRIQQLIVAPLHYVQEKLSTMELTETIKAPLHYIQEKLSTMELTEAIKEDASDRECDEIVVSSATDDKNAEAITDDSRQNYRTAIASHFPYGVPTDPVHEEAFSILKKLQIIEKDVSSSDFCTRREFARWFVKLCSKFERKKMQRIVPNKLTSGAVQCAFDDVNIDDPDFLYIQSLGESGIVSSKLSNSLETLTSGSPSKEDSLFLPDGYLSRFDLVNWKVLVEHPFALEIDQKMLSQNVCILDLRACPDVSPSMLIELMAGENSIISRVFGNTRRLQPHKPVTKAQAAAALTSGRMMEAIQEELNRLEAENQAQLSVIAEIMEELISRGDIQQQWEEKMKKEQERALEVDNNLQHVLHELANEKADREGELADLLKERAALERENQELVNLRSEVDGMYDRLATENEEVMADQQTLESQLSDMTSKHQAVSEAKSYLEAEKEALTMLKTWVEDEAARVHERAETLEKALRRWRIPED